MCSEGILILKELFTASLDGYIFAPISSRVVSYKRGHFLILYVSLRLRLSNKTDHSSFLTILRFLFLCFFFYNFANIPYTLQALNNAIDVVTKRKITFVAKTRDAAGLVSIYDFRNY